MKLIFLILILSNTQFAMAQYGIDDSLITTSVSFNTLKNKMNEIDSIFSNKDSITYTIPFGGKWSLICSYKKGWKEIIGASTNDSSGIKMNRQVYNDIRIQKKDSNFFTTDTLKKIFHLTDSEIIKDKSGNTINSPMVMTKNGKYLIIGLGSSYPNGNQTSWDYTHTFYFKRQL